jgi:catechol 2,3-dioxygenase-like lactoylglutathione lyase family enzyme
MPVTGIDNKVLTQVCIIVRDVEASYARYAEIFGFGNPWDFQTTLLHDHTKATYYGEPTDARAKIAGWEIGRIQFELLQPLDPRSSWYDFLEQHGEGIHHIAFFVPKTGTAADSLKQYGYAITQQGLFTGQGGSYTYLDTDKDMGIVLELLEHFGGNPKLDAPPHPADTGLGTDRVIQVGLIVNDIEAMRQRWSAVLGVPLPPIQQTPGYEQVKTTYNGQRCDGTAKLAFMNFGQITVELIEPDETPSVWRDWLNEHGEGAQHIAFPVPDTQRAVEHFAKFGVPVAQQGFYSDHSGMYTYMDSQAALGTTIELLENFKK